MVRQRRAAAAVVFALVAGSVLGAAALGGDDESDAGATASEPSVPPPELPRGGREIFPRHRVVAFYGAPQDRQLGALGIGSPAGAAARLERQARAYRPSGRPVLPAFELIAVVAAYAPGADGLYRTRQPARVIDRYLAAARKARMLLILDIQPGHADFLREVRALRRWLLQPDVSLALDPEWHTPGQVPGRSIGSVTAEKVNEVSAYLSGIVRSRRLPQKLLVVHQFTHDMIEGKSRLAHHPGVALTINVDGFGGRAIKIAKYRSFVRYRDGFHHGLKLFYEEDTNLLKPRSVLALRPRPELVVYE